jgi:integrase
MGTIKFLPRLDKGNRKNKFPVRLIYSQNGKRRYYATAVSMPISNWDEESQRAVFRDKKAAKFMQDAQDKIKKIKLPFATDTEVGDWNRSLTKIELEIQEIEKRFNLDRIAFTSEMVINKFKENRNPEAVTSNPRDFLHDFIDTYIEDHSTTQEPGTLIVFKTLKTHLEDFQTFKKKRITFSSINYSFFVEFQNFLVSDYKVGPDKTRDALSNITTAKKLSTIKQLLLYAKHNGINVPDITYGDFKNKLKKGSKKVIALTNDEFIKLYEFDLSANLRLARVRDIFVFSCATGLRYSDLMLLRRENIYENEIRFTVKKTKTDLTIPLTKYSRKVLNTYKELDTPLPQISNQKANDYLKELCEIAEIDEDIEITKFYGINQVKKSFKKFELIGMHTGRKSFCTLSLDRGMSITETMSISGHRDFKSFEKYVKVHEESRKKAMSQAWK